MIVYILSAILVPVVLYLVSLGIMTKVASYYNCPVMYNKHKRCWEVWMGDKSVNTKVDIIIFRGYPLMVSIQLILSGGKKNG